MKKLILLSITSFQLYGCNNDSITSKRTIDSTRIEKDTVKRIIDSTGKPIDTSLIKD